MTGLPLALDPDVVLKHTCSSTSVPFASAKAVGDQFHLNVVRQNMHISVMSLFLSAYYSSRGWQLK